MITNIFIIILVIFIFLLFATFAVHLFFFLPYVPTEHATVTKMITAAKLKDGETVLDLGCGDGRLLIAAEKASRVKGIGFELAPLVFILAYIKTKLSAPNSKVFLKNIFKVNLSEADVIFCYLMPNLMKDMVKKIKAECKPGTRIISNTFHMSDLEPSDIIPKDTPRGTPTVYVYKIV